MRFYGERQGYAEAAVSTEPDEKSADAALRRRLALD
jgi:hypothetical protein